MGEKMSETRKLLRSNGVKELCRGILCDEKVLIGDKYCESCRGKYGYKEVEERKERHKVYNKFRRDKSSQDFYSNPKHGWKKKRDEIWNRDEGLCQSCLRKGIYKMGNVVHHKKELKDYPELRLESSNLEVLCHRCHNQFHGGRSW